MVNFLGCNLLDSVIIPSMRDSRYKFAWCILGFSHVEFGYRHLRSFQRYSHALLKVFFPSLILVIILYIFIFLLLSTPIVKIEDATFIQLCDRKRRFSAEKTSTLKQSRDIQMFCWQEFLQKLCEVGNTLKES